MPWQSGPALPQLSYPASQDRHGTVHNLTELHLLITRREFCQRTATVTLVTAVLGVCSLPPFESLALADTVPAAELMKPDALP